MSETAVRGRGRRAMRWALWIVGSLLTLWLLAWLAVPPLVKSQAEQRLSALLGREVRIGSINFSPWSLTLEIERFVIASAAGASAPPQFEIAKLTANADLRSVLRLAPVIEALDIDAPVLRAARVAEGRYDFDDIVERLARMPAAPPNGNDEPQRFALYNLRLHGGRIEIDDRPVQRRHRLQELRLSLPFLSNLPDDIAVEVQPRLAFKLDGAAFDSGAQTTPFAQDRASQIDVTISGLDLAPWLPYVPASVPLRPTRGMLTTRLQLQFAAVPGATPRMSLRGQIGVADAALAAGASEAPVLAWRQLDVALVDVQPLARQVALGDVTLAGAQVDARRDAQGRINLVPAAGVEPVPSPQRPASAASGSATPTTPTAPWQVSIAKVALTQARVDWHDAATRPAAAMRIEPLDAQVTQLRWPMDVPAPFTLNAALGALDTKDSASGETARLTLQGQGSDRMAQAQLELQGLNLAWLEPYLAASLSARLEGRATGRTSVQWSAGEAAQIKLADTGVDVEQIKLLEGARAQRTALGVARLSVADATVDLTARRLSLGTVRVERPSLGLSRDAQGRWNFEQWTRTAADAPTPTAADAAATAATPWSLRLGELRVTDAELRLDDQRAAEGATSPVRLRAALSAQVRDFAWPSGPPAKTQLQLRLSPLDAPAGGATVGRIDWNGSLSPAPIAARGSLRVERFPVHLFEPYFGNGLNLALLRAEADWRGDIAVAQRGAAWDASAKGNARIADLRVHERAGAGALNVAATRGGDELLTWQALSLDGLKFEMRAGAKPRLEIGAAALDDFYSRLVITEDGRFNLRDVAAAPKGDNGAAAPVATASAVVVAAPAPVLAASAATPGSELPIHIVVGSVRLGNGRVDFTDRFIKPNYSAALSELNGRLGAFDSATRDMATLELKGRAAGTALLEIGGSLNPTAQPLALDIRAKATDLELAPLSPYAGRYAGYAIERGKLSMDVAYRIDPDGKLDAKNQVVLNQLTFGDKVESPDATKLPVLLAVALLKDRNGVIDINLPISGSINDPQFSVFGLVLKVIGNLLVKALTAPFALLAGGGSEDLSFVAFETGTNVFNDAGKATIDKVAKALTDRPALKMTVTGAADPASEREPIQRATLDARVVAEQRRDALRAGAAADAPLPALSPPQREALLKRIYDDSNLPDKPRNVLGLAKGIPAAEMEALLLRATVVSTDSARELALRRGLAVRDALIAKGLPSERLFIAAPKLRASGEEDAAWSPRVQLALSTN
jgi:uncharacterized protein involved in outer membrane biogenesis